MALVVAIILSEVEPHALEIVHVKVYVLLDASPVATAVGEFAFVNVIPVEGDAVHVPVSHFNGFISVC